MTAGEQFLAALAKQEDAREESVPRESIVSPHGTERTHQYEERLEALLAESRTSRHVGYSEDRGVVAVVDGTGHLVSMEIHRGALTQRHPHLLGGQVKDAVLAARQEAALLERQLLATLRLETGKQ